MKLEKIIELFGESIGRNLLIKRELIASETFKAYKTYKITLYEITKSIKMDKRNNVDEILGIQVTDKIIDTTKEKIIENAEKEFLIKVFKHYGSKSVSDTNN